MPIQNGSLVTLKLHAFDEDGDPIDEEEGGEPYSYEHGAGELPAGLEAALDGLGPGDTFEVRVEPELGFGVQDPELLIAIPRDELPEGLEVEVGDWLPIEMRPETPEEGEELEETEVPIVSIDADAVVVDLNHPLAGQTLIFRGEILTVE